MFGAVYTNLQINKVNDYVLNKIGKCLSKFENVDP